MGKARTKHFWPRYKAKGRELIIEIARQGMTQEAVCKRVTDEQKIPLSKGQTSRIFQGVSECPDYVADAIAKVLGKKTRILFDVIERPQQQHAA